MPVKSKYPDIELVDCGLYEYLFASLKEEDEERTAIIDVADGSETNYAQLRNYIESTAGWLHHKGIRKGDVVALHLPNSLAFVIAVHAIWRMGAVVTPVNLLSTPASIANQMADSGATMYLTAAALGEVGAEGAREGGIAEDRIVALDTASGLQQILAERRKAPAVEVRGSDLAALPYSSGTTGLPKGVCLNHHQLVNNIVQAQAFGITRREDVVYGVLPFFHIYGMTALMNLVVAQRAVLVAVPRFDLQSFLEHHQKYSVTFTMIAPPIAVALAKHPMVDNYDLSSMRAIFSGAATMDTELALAVEKRLGIHMQQGFGMTETSPFAHGNLDKDVERGSIGRPAPSTEHMIVDVESGEEIPTPDDGKSEVGELWVRGPQIMEGYLNRPEETAHALPGDGWLRTGDLACHDADGNAFVVDRLKELIKYKGYQVPPAELEALLLTHEAISDAAVVGVIREDDGEEIPKAFVVKQEGTEVTAEEIMEFVAERVAPYKKIRAVEFIEQVPKSATGKILRRTLKG